MTSLLPKYRNDQPEDGQHHDRTLKRMMSYSYKLCLLTLVVICMPVFIRELGNSLKSMAESDTSEEPAAMQQVYDDRTGNMSIEAFNCRCTLPQCVADGSNMCRTRSGCFVELPLVLPGAEDSANELRARKLNVEIGHNNAQHDETEFAAGCLDLLPINVGCADIMRSVNSTNPIFPTLRLPWSTVTRRPGRVIQAYRCCNNDLCNEDAQISTVARTLGSPRALFNGTAAPADQLMANGTVTPAEQRMTNGTVAPAEQRMTNGTIAPVEQRMTNGTVAPVEQQMANGTQTAAAASESSPSKQ